MQTVDIGPFSLIFLMGLGTRLLHNMYYVTLFLEVQIAFSISVRVSDVLPPPPPALIYQWMLNVSSITHVPLCAFSCKVVWHFSFVHTRFREGQGNVKVIWRFNSVVTPVTIYGQLRIKCEVCTVHITFEGEKFCKFCGFVAICESFLREILGRGILGGGAKASNPRKFSSRKLYFSPICDSFLLQKFSGIQYMHKFRHLISSTLFSSKFPKSLANKRKATCT